MRGGSVPDKRTRASHEQQQVKHCTRQQACEKKRATGSRTNSSMSKTKHATRCEAGLYPTNARVQATSSNKSNIAQDSKRVRKREPLVRARTAACQKQNTQRDARRVCTRQTHACKPRAATSQTLHKTASV